MLNYRPRYVLYCVPFAVMFNTVAYVATAVLLAASAGYETNGLTPFVRNGVTHFSALLFAEPGVALMFIALYVVCARVYWYDLRVQQLCVLAAVALTAFIALDAANDVCGLLGLPTFLGNFGVWLGSRLALAPPQPAS
jgi:hypothetical protein